MIGFPGCSDTGLRVVHGSEHRGLRSTRGSRWRHPNLLPVHGPANASWLSQIEIYFSVLLRKALTPNDFASLEHLAVRLRCFERHYEAIAKPFEWRLTRANLQQLPKRIQSPGPSCFQLAARSHNSLVNLGNGVLSLCPRGFQMAAGPAVRFPNGMRAE